MSVGTLKEIIYNDHAIISTLSGPEHYVAIMSFVDKDLLEPGCTVLLHHKSSNTTNSYNSNAIYCIHFGEVLKELRFLRRIGRINHKLLLGF